MLLAPDIASDVLAAARRGGADFAEIYAERWRRRNLRLADRAVMEATSGIEYGAGLRLFYGLDVVYAYTNELDAASLLALCEKLCQLRGRTGQVNAAGAGGLDFRAQRAGGLHAPTLAFDARDKAARLAWLHEADAGARVSPEIARVETRLAEWEQEVLVANSEGVWVEDERVWTRLHVTAIAESPGEMQTGSAAPGLATGLDLMERFPPRGVGREAGDQAMVDKMGALKTGYRPTGSGRRENYSLAPTSRMRNTFIAAGDTPKADLLFGHRAGALRQEHGRRQPDQRRLLGAGPGPAIPGRRIGPAGRELRHQRQLSGPVAAGDRARQGSGVVLPGRLFRRADGRGGGAVLRRGLNPVPGPKRTGSTSRDRKALDSEKSG